MAPKLRSSGRESLSQQRGRKEAKLQLKGNTIHFGPEPSVELLCGERERKGPHQASDSVRQCEGSEFQG